MSSPANASLLTVEVSDDRRVHALRGELCLSTVDLLREPLFAAVDANEGHIVVDLTGCTFLDSSGLEVLALASWRLAATDPRRELIVVSPRSAVRRILDLTGMDHIVTVRDTRPPPDAEMSAKRARTVARSLASG